MLDLRRLEILHRFAARGSISATAADLGYSASAISQQLATLEREAGVALIERTAHSANLTDAGRELVEHATVVLDAAETAQSAMRARANTIGGRIDISCIPGLAAVIAPHLAVLQREHEGLVIVAHETESTIAAAAVLDRSSDLAVIDDWTRDPSLGAGLAMTRLRREQVVLAIPSSHPAAGEIGQIGAATLRSIVRSETWLSAPAGQHSRVAGDERLSAIGAEPLRRWEFEGLHVRAALVQAEAGVAFLPDSIAAEQPGVASLALRPRMYRDVIALTRTTNQQDPATQICLDAARQALSG
jgi:DNA-binding transcriptional LysR family regulator